MHEMSYGNWNWWILRISPNLGKVCLKFIKNYPLKCISFKAGTKASVFNRSSNCKVQFEIFVNTHINYV